MRESSDSSILSTTNPRVLPQALPLQRRGAFSLNVMDVPMLCAVECIAEFIEIVNILLVSYRRIELACSSPELAFGSSVVTTMMFNPRTTPSLSRMIHTRSPQDANLLHRFR